MWCVCKANVVAKITQKGIQMVINVCGWRLKPSETNGRRCWQLYHGKSTRPERFYDELGKALRFVAEWELRNGTDGTADVIEALGRYDAIAERIERAAREVS